MKGLLLLGCLSISFLLLARAEEGTQFQGFQRFLQKERFDQTSWGQLNYQDWHSLTDWVMRQDLLTKNPFHDLEQIRDNYSEEIGRVVSCLGVCRKVIGRRSFSLAENMRLQEGDEIQTLPSSYLWMVLYDGTLLRLGPSSSFDLREWSLSGTQSFLYARLNYGLVQVLPRLPSFSLFLFFSLSSFLCFIQGLVGLGNLCLLLLL